MSTKELDILFVELIKMRSDATIDDFVGAENHIDFMKGVMLYKTSNASRQHIIHWLTKMTFKNPNPVIVKVGLQK